MRLLLSLIIFASATSIPISKDTCPDGGVQSTINKNLCYLYVNLFSMFDDAEKTCAEYTGGHIASSTSGLVNSEILGK